MHTAIGVTCVVVGVLMVGWWTLDIRGGALRRPDRTRAEIGLHLVAELLTAVLLVAGGVVLLLAEARSLALVALGMLLYTVIQSPGYFLARRELAPAGTGRQEGRVHAAGYFLARRELAPVIMFAVLAAITVLAATWLLLS